jgi:hypothetical protein
LGRHRVNQQSLEYFLYRSVYGPLWEWYFLCPSKVQALKMTPHRNAKDWANAVVHPAN